MEKEKQLKYYKKQLETIYKTTTKPARQKALLSKKICFICDKISQLESEITEIKTSV